MIYDTISAVENVSLNSNQVLTPQILINTVINSILEFMAACIIVGLEHLHKNGILHRDIKPENLVLDENGIDSLNSFFIIFVGFVRITDLGIARYWRPDNACDTSGTPGYMAPEVMCR